MIDINKIKQVLPHRYPFLLIDRILSYEADLSAHAIKCVTINEPFFDGHFPGRPLMPGVLIIEAIVQTACFTVAMKLKDQMKNPGVSFMTIDKCKFRKPVIPDCILELKIEAIRSHGRVWKYKGEAYVEGKKMADAQWSASIVDRK